MKFDIEKFMTFKVNTYAFKNESGGCVQCAMSHALGLETGSVSQTYNGKEVMLDSFRRFGGQGFVNLMKNSEDLLHNLAIEGKAVNRNPGDIFAPNILTVEKESKIKKYVLDGMKELGLIKELELVNV
jgi:hypothetical protein